MNLHIDLLVIVLLLCCSAFFSSSETALFSLNRLRLKRKAEKHPLSSWFVSRLLEHPRSLLQIILIGNEVTNTATSVVVAAFCYNLFHDKVPPVIATLIPVVVATPLLMIFGEIGPKAVAIQRPEQISRLNAPLLTVFSFVVRPLQLVIDRFVRWFVEGVLRVPLRSRVDLAANLDEDTFRSMLDITHSEGEVEGSEREFIHRVLELDDIQVRELMTRREKVFALELSTPLEKSIDEIKRQRFSRIPIYQNSSSKIVGILYTKDLLRQHNGSRGYLKSLMRSAYIIPQTRNVSKLLRDFQEHRIHIAIVVNEYGDFVGVITMQDILERLFGSGFPEQVEEMQRPDV